MAEETAKTGAVSGEPELVDVDFDGKKVTVTKAHAEILKETERQLRDSSRQKFEDAAKERKETEKQAALIEEDVNWLNSHDPTEYKNYELKSRGGRGYVGNDTTVNPAMSGNIYSPDDEVRSNAEIDGLKAEIKELKSQLGSVIKKDEDDAVNATLETKEKILNQFKIKQGSKMDSILTDQLYAFHAKNKRPATPNEANKLLTDVLGEFGKKAELPPEKPSVGGTPPVGGEPPSPPPPEKLDFRGTDGMERYKEHFSQHMTDALKH